MTDTKIVLDSRMKPRFKICVAAKIKAQLIGSASAFDFVTENISETGLLVSHGAGQRPSFNTHTILEVWIQTESHQDIFFFAKYVRQASENSFAITICDIDTNNLEKFQSFINHHLDAEPA